MNICLKTMSTKNILHSHKCVPNVEYNSVGEYVWNELLKLDERTVCLIDARSEEQLTIAELKTRANSIAVALIERGINKTDKIAFYGQNSIQHSILRFTTYFLGNSFLGLSPTFGSYEVEQEVGLTEANIVFSSAQDLHKFDGLLKDEKKIKMVFVFDGKHDKYTTYEQLLEEGRDQTLERIPYFDVNLNTDMFCYLYTSGSTGRAKCAMITQNSLLCALSEKDSFMQTNDSTGRIVLFVFPYGHASGTKVLTLQVVAGATLVLLDRPSVEEIFKCIEKYKITFLPIFTYVCKQLIDSPLVVNYDLSSLRAIGIGGSPLAGSYTKSIVKKYGVIFKEVYAMTEYGFVTEGARDDDDLIPGNLGRVSSGTELKIVDLITGENLGAGIDGEIRIRGTKMFAGYVNNESTTKEAFDSEGWYRTGDIGHYDKKGRLFLTGRLKEMMTILADKIYTHLSPVEVEEFVSTHTAIADVVVVGVKNNIGYHFPRAYVLLRQGCVASAEEIQRYVSDRLAPRKHLTGGVVFVDVIRRTGIGKVDRQYYKNLVSDEVIVILKTN